VRRASLIERRRPHQETEASARRFGGTERLQGRNVVKTKMLIVAILALAGVACVHSADQSDVKSVLEKFQSVRPTEADLALYRLDWMPTLEAAKERAAKEERPIFLVVVTNSFGDLFSGHC
jgi:hypothetical protein